MRRPTFFISSRSHSADLLAAELILAVYDQFPKTEAVGVLGKWSIRTRASALLELDALHAACITLGMEEGLRPLKEGLAENLPQIAVLVGYSSLHHDLAGFFHKLEIPVILYEITPHLALKGVNFAEAKERIKAALSIHRGGSAFLRDAHIPFQYIGTPYRDRVAKAIVNASAFTFLDQRPLVTLFPGGYGESLIKMLPLFAKLSEALLADGQTQVVLSLREEVDFEKCVAEIKSKLPLALANKINIVLGMHLELLSLSHAVVTGPGAITIEATIALKPFLPIYHKGDTPDDAGSFALINQSLGKRLIAEYCPMQVVQSKPSILNMPLNFMEGCLAHEVYKQHPTNVEEQTPGSLPQASKAGGRRRQPLCCTGHTSCAGRGENTDCPLHCLVYFASSHGPSHGPLSA
ncbi:MAG: hypothetical protein EOO38_21655, partial [Cytophagaceae bacterium]